jgi:ribosome biogenesis GTPase A
MKTCRIINTFKPDGSLSKDLASTLKKEENKFILIYAKNRLLGKELIQTLLEALKEENILLRQRIKFETHKLSNIAFYDESPVITIQKFVRGWQSRKTYEKVSIT